jgi:hypothetical protein
LAEAAVWPIHGTDRRVLGLPGLSYYFHGIGCCLTHDDGTELDVNFDENGAEGIDSWFYDRFLSTAPLEPLEQMLKAGAPFGSSWMFDLASRKLESSAVFSVQKPSNHVGSAGRGSVARSHRTSSSSRSKL